MQVQLFSVLLIGFFSHCLCGRWINTYNVLDYGARGDRKTDDTHAFLSAWNSTCGAKGKATLIIPPKKFYLVNNLELKGPCKATNILIQLKGKIVAPRKEALKDGSHWIRIKNINGLTIDGTRKGRIDGYGSTWWQCKSCPRPVALYFSNCNDLSVSNVRITNSPGGHIAINVCNNAKFFNLVVHSPGHSPNTDGFDIANSKNIAIENSTIHTGDDCIAINGGSSYINVTRVVCGSGHGISIGSLGKCHSHEIVEEVHVQNCSFTNTSNGARIKTFPGGSGYARKITFKQIELTNVKNAIIIDQHYGVSVAKESAVQVSDVKYYGFKGTSADDLGINLDCMRCFNIVLDQINITSSDRHKHKLHPVCKNFHGAIGSTIPRLSCN